MLYDIPLGETNIYLSSQQNRAIIASPENTILKKLEEYSLSQDRPDSLMVFLRIPSSKKGAKEIAKIMANTIKDFEQAGFSPIFIFEPSVNEVGASLGKIRVGTYDEYLSLLFFTLSDTYHITETQLGLIIPYPEINTPAFSRKNFAPGDFSIIVNQFFRIAQRQYPTLSGGILLDSKTYDEDTWTNGKYKSLSPYLNGLNKRYIHTVGLQGFPWISEDASVRSTAVRSYLPSPILLEAANLVGTKKVWINTGTIGKKYGNTIHILPEERKQSLDALMSYLRFIKKRGYTPLIHIFARNNSAIPGDTTDWSYTQSENDKKILQNFIKESHSMGIQVGFHDQ